MPRLEFEQDTAVSPHPGIDEWKAIEPEAEEDHQPAPDVADAPKLEPTPYSTSLDVDEGLHLPSQLIARLVENFFGEE
ncbi:hypothetical protein [Massilia sp. DD77]|uniref:hypothetical protein n=1 Tax=Massilia sp. DD77 TaxID=3109349 RepID=UPI002FFF73FC